MSQPQEERPPYVPPKLLKWLDENIPHRCPHLDMTDRSIWFYAGQRQIVDLLHRLQEEQEEEELGAP